VSAPRVVLYHAGCDDGFGAAWAAWRALGDRAMYLPVNYGQPAPTLPDGAIVTIVDFAYPRDTLLRLRERVLLHVLDHHKSAAEDLAGLDFAVFDMTKSGARLAWEHFHPGVELPALLAYVEDRDLWRFALSCTKEITAYVRSYPRDFDTWQMLDSQVCDHINTPLSAGGAILRATNQLVAAHVDHAHLTDFDGMRVPCVNATMLQSEIGAALCERFPGAPFSLTYFDREDGLRVWSLRTTRADVDCSAIASRHGGGGHPGAAGFTTEVRS
jgi:oligoribonuclease NrnB/cAMP/cGMP phosphodiesterase (DHH superfamily)